MPVALAGARYQGRERVRHPERPRRAVILAALGLGRLLFITCGGRVALVMIAWQLERKPNELRSVRLGGDLQGLRQGAVRSRQCRALDACKGNRRKDCAAIGQPKHLGQAHHPRRPRWRCMRGRQGAPTLVSIETRCKGEARSGPQLGQVPLQAGATGRARQPSRGRAQAAWTGADCPRFGWPRGSGARSPCARPSHDNNLRHASYYGLRCTSESTAVSGADHADLVGGAVARGAAALVDSGCPRPFGSGRGQTSSSRCKARGSSLA